MRGLVCAGNITLDVLTRPVDTLQWDTTTLVESIQQEVGGNGALTAMAAALLGQRVLLLGAVGRDAAGEFVLGAVKRAGVDISLVERLAAPTPVTSVLVRSDGARALLHRPGANREAFEAPIAFEDAAREGFGHFHLANVFPLWRLRGRAAAELAAAREAGLTTSLDTGWDALGEWMSVIGPCLEHLDLLIVNRDEARVLAGTDDPAGAAARFRACGARTVVVKLGGSGCAVFGPEGGFHSAAYDVPAVDTTGAGDTFVGAFLAGWLGGGSLREAAELANAVGALSVQALGGARGLRDLEGTREWMRAARRR